jgi:hypothetical protein
VDGCQRIIIIIGAGGVISFEDGLQVTGHKGGGISSETMA